jgi:hypothetical protein
MRGDGVRRYPNGSSRQPPIRGLLTLDETMTLDRALYDLRALGEALPTVAARHDALVAVRAIKRLLAADDKRRGNA